jgi:proteasome accessory factor B
MAGKKKALRRSRGEGLVRTQPGANDGDMRGTMRLLEAVVRAHHLLAPGRTVSTETLRTVLEYKHRRSVIRIIKFMRESLHAEIESDREGGYRYAGKPVSLPAPALSEGDLLSLYVASPILAQYRDTELGERFESSFRKIAALLPQPMQSRLFVLPNRIEAKARVPSHKDASHFVKALDAVQRDRKIDMVYKAASTRVTTTRVVDPYALCVVNSNWYLIGYDHSRRAVRKFALSRVWSMHVTERGFKRPPSFNASDLLKDAFGIYESPDPHEPLEEIVIRFDALAAPYVRETTWHESQTSRMMNDGGFELTLKVRGTIEVERFVLAWGEHARVVAPERLREKMRARLEAALRQYSSER